MAERQKTATISAAVVVLAILGVVALLAWGWTSPNRDVPGLEDESAPPNVGVTLSDVADNVNRYLGRTVTVSGEVEDALSNRAFTIGGEDFGDELLVIAREPLSDEQTENLEGIFKRDDIIQATGTVAVFIEEDVERDLGVDLDSQLFQEFDRQPAIIADQIVINPRTITNQ